MKLPEKKYVTELIGLDLLRFLLSISVMLRHYYHFYFPFIPDEKLIAGKQPFYNLLWIFYHYGEFAVQIFWVISGLIFYTVYADPIHRGTVSLRTFTTLRFSRLYPLHFLTLIFAAILQWQFYHTHKTFFVYPENDLEHFILNIFFMSAWRPAFDFSFNVPIWSVSIEIFVYFLFFFLARVTSLRSTSLYIILLLSLLFNFFDILSPFNDCMFFFFSGCIIARLLSRGKSARKLLLICISASLFFGIAVQWIKHLENPYNIGHYNSHLAFPLFAIFISASILLFFIVVFRKVSTKRIASNIFRALGNMTYSIYLIHFPIQLMIFLIIQPEDFQIFNHPLLLLSFVLITIILGWVIFELYERPAQKYLRHKLL